MLKLLISLLLSLNILFATTLTQQNQEVMKKQFEDLSKDTITKMLDNYKDKENITFNDNIVEITSFKIKESFDLNNVEEINFLIDNKNRILFVINTNNRFIYFTDFMIYQKILFVKMKLKIENYLKNTFNK